MVVSAMSMSEILTSLPHMQQLAEQLMTDRVRIERLTGQMSVDPETGLSEPESVLVYEGPAKLQTYGGIAQQSAASATGDTSNLGGVVPVWSLRLDLPVSVVGARSGDIAMVVASRDAALTGSQLRLINLQSEKTHATARRWNVQEIPHSGGGDTP
ncbi:hypothetical protein DWV92_09430 [Bifidobacterium pseudolongum]|uniref:Phage associated protein n=2 Tax=Bifidobacterium pseudolongum TaxID=1694 RepID=A0A395XGJ0_9BIFI|nr:hypothetical protein DWV92_09430 [Bifidobacterium pseudolongum]